MVMSLRKINKIFAPKKKTFPQEKSTLCNSFTYLATLAYQLIYVHISILPNFLKILGIKDEQLFYANWQILSDGM